MKSIAITGTKRAAQSKKELRALRAEGKVPCVLYGGKEQIHFSAPVLSFRGLVYTPNVHTVDLTVDGINFKAVMQDIQFHSVNNKILHIDFLELFEEKKVVVSIPVWLKGTPSGVRAGGQMLAKMRKLKISALPKHLPDSVELNVEKLEIGDAIRVRDMKIDGVEFLDISANSIVAVKTTRVVVEEVAVATATTAVAGAPGAAAVPGAPGAAPAAGAPAADAKAAPAKEEKKK